MVPCVNGTVLSDPPLVYDLLLHLHIQGNCQCSQNYSKSVRRNGARRTCRNSGTSGGKGTASCGCNTSALIPTLHLPLYLVSIPLPSASSSKLPVHRSPGGNCLILRAFTTPLAVPIGLVFDPSIGPTYLPCSNHESRGPRRRLDGCKGIHHTRSPNCAKGGTARLPTFRSCAVLPSRPTANRRCMLTAYGASHVNRSWSAGTSAPEADSTASLIDLTRPLTTFTELSAAPLDCGSPSADVACTTSPVQASFTALSSDRVEGFVVTPKHHSVVTQSVQIFNDHLHHLFTTWEVNSFCGNLMSKK